MGPDQPAVAIETHGCKLNQADSAQLARRFTDAGFRMVPADSPADVYVLNSCTVTHVADRKARHALRSARRRSPTAIIVASGCYPQRAREDVQAIDEVDMAFGTLDRDSLVEAVSRRVDGALTQVVAEGVSGLARETPRVRAMVKIQEGCDQVCAFCIVPKVRGRERSIPADEVVGDIARLVSEGYREVVLTGTQLGSYGFEVDGMDLSRLLAMILEKTEVERLRVSSLQPQDITPGLLSLWSDPRLCPHFHLPLQSGSDGVLKRMRRRYSAAGYARVVEAVRETVAHVSVTADVIVGFPGESDADFQKTLEYCSAMGFADLHVFPYSLRPGTGAAKMEGQVPPEVKSARMGALTALAKDHAAKYRRSILGSVRSVLWESPVDSRRGEGWWSGLTDSYMRVHAESARPLANTLTDARMEALEGAVVRATVLP